MQFVQKRWRKGPYALCKSCRGSRDLQLWYSNVCPLQFNFLEKTQSKCASLSCFGSSRSRARRPRWRWARTPRLAFARWSVRRGTHCAAPPSLPHLLAPRVTRAPATPRRPSTLVQRCHRRTPLHVAASLCPARAALSCAPARPSLFRRRCAAHRRTVPPPADHAGRRPPCARPWRAPAAGHLPAIWCFPPPSLASTTVHRPVHRDQASPVRRNQSHRGRPSLAADELLAGVTSALSNTTNRAPSNPRPSPRPSPAASTGELVGIGSPAPASRVQGPHCKANILSRVPAAKG
jgi:hypothetical protein